MIECAVGGQAGGVFGRADIEFEPVIGALVRATDAAQVFGFDARIGPRDLRLEFDFRQRIFGLCTWGQVDHAFGIELVGQERLVCAEGCARACCFGFGWQDQEKQFALVGGIEQVVELPFKAHTEAGAAFLEVTQERETNAEIASHERQVCLDGGAIGIADIGVEGQPRLSRGIVQKQHDDRQKHHWFIGDQDGDVASDQAVARIERQGFGSESVIVRGASATGTRRKVAIHHVQLSRNPFC